MLRLKRAALQVSGDLQASPDKKITHATLAAVQDLLESVNSDLRGLFGSAIPHDLAELSHKIFEIVKQTGVKEGDPVDFKKFGDFVRLVCSLLLQGRATTLHAPRRRTGS